VEVNVSRSALLMSDSAFAGRPIEQREAINDSRGHVAELLAKAIRKGALDEEITAEDRERMLAFLRSFGDLRADYVYAGSSRAGLRQLPGAGDIEEQTREPLPMYALLDCLILARLGAGRDVRSAGHHATTRGRHGPDCLRVCAAAGKDYQIRMPCERDPQDSERRSRGVRRARRDPEPGGVLLHLPRCPCPRSSP